MTLRQFARIVGIAALSCAGAALGIMLQQHLDNRRMWSAAYEALSDETKKEMTEWRRWERLKPKLSDLYAGTIDIPTCDGKTDMTSALQDAFTKVENINNERRYGWRDYERCVVPHAVRMHGGTCLLSTPVKVYGWVHFEGGGAELMATGDNVAIEAKTQDKQP